MMKIKKLITFCLSAMLAASSCSHAFAAGRPGTWASNDKGWWIAYEDGSYLTNDWYQSPTSGLWYYMGADGYMLTNTTTPDGYWVNADGVWIEGSAGNTGSSTDSATQSAWKNEFRTKWTAAYNDAAGNSGSAGPVRYGFTMALPDEISEQTVRQMCDACAASCQGRAYYWYHDSGENGILTITAVNSTAAVPDEMKR